MDRKSCGPADIIDLLCKVEKALSRGEKVDQVCRRLDLPEESYNHWHQWSTPADLDTVEHSNGTAVNEAAKRRESGNVLRLASKTE